MPRQVDLNPSLSAESLKSRKLIINTMSEDGRRILRSRVASIIKKNSKGAYSTHFANRTASAIINKAKNGDFQHLLNVFEIEGSQRIKYKRGFISWLADFEWSYFVTFTFNQRTKTPLGVTDFEMQLQGLLTTEERITAYKYDEVETEYQARGVHNMMELFFHQTSKIDYRQWTGVYVIEAHKSGHLHVHAMLANERSKPEKDAKQIRKVWRSIRGGYCKVDNIRSSHGCLIYMSKYITKTFDRNGQNHSSWAFLTSEGGINFTPRPNENNSLFLSGDGNYITNPAVIDVLGVGRFKRLKRLGFDASIKNLTR